MSWASRRKTLYSFTTLAVVLALGVVAYYAFFATDPTCADDVQNGDERGVDCGGACSAICSQDAREPVVLWSRALKVADSFYTAAAYVENRNGGAKARRARYVFKLVDEKNILVAERFGEVTLAAQRFVPIIEANIATGNRVPARTFFEFVGELSWEKEVEGIRLRVTDQMLDEKNGEYSLTVSNDGRKEVRNIIVPVVLFDAQGNAQAASKSVIERLVGGGSDRVMFTWPEALPPITRAEAIPYRNEQP